MKSYLPMAIAAAVVVVGLGAAFFLTPSLAPPQAQLEQQIADKVAQAEAMLATYSPADEALLRMFDSAATTQPSTASQPATELDGQVRSALEKRKNLIADALKVVKEAVGTRIEAGDASVGGDSDVAATRLEAILVAEQAQVLRREAAYHWRRSAAARDEVRTLLANWTHLDTQIRSQQATLSGQGVLPTAGALATPTAAPTDAAGAAAEPAITAAPAAGTASGHSRVGSAIGQLFSMAGNKKKSAATAPTAAPAAAVPEPAPEPKVEVAVAPPPATSRPARAALPAECTLAMSMEQLLARQTQSPAQRVEDLQRCRQAVQARFAEAQQRVEALTPQVADLHGRIDAAKSIADASQKKMMELERAGVDATDPKSLPRFTQEYNDASAAYRKALRTISALTAGAVAQATLTPEEKEMVSEAPVAVDAAADGEQRGVLALEGDLAAAQVLVESQKKLLAQIDAESDRLATTQKHLQEYVAKLDKGRSEAATALASAAKTAVTEAVTAYDLERQALQLLEGEGTRAARQAQQAASSVVEQAQSAGAEHAENPRYPQIEKDRYSIAAAKTSGGDIDAAKAATLAQRADNLQRHAQLLEQLAPAGVVTAATTQPAGEQAGAGEAAGAWAVEAPAALAEVETSRAEAAKAATAAIDAYKSADNDTGSTKRLWTIHAQMAAMHYLLGNVTTGDESAKHYADARKTFELATRDRQQRPEVQSLRPAYDNLAQAK